LSVWPWLMAVASLCHPPSMPPPPSLPPPCPPGSPFLFGVIPDSCLIHTEIAPDRARCCCCCFPNRAAIAFLLRTAAATSKMATRATGSTIANVDDDDDDDDAGLLLVVVWPAGCSFLFWFWSRSLGPAADFAGVVGALVGAALGLRVDCAVGRAVGRAVGVAVGEGEDWVGAFARGREGQGSWTHCSQNVRIITNCWIRYAIAILHVVLSM
jgi:hypothetical protein